MKKKISAVLASLAILLGIGVVNAPASSALNIYYQSELRCKVGVYPLLTYYKWYKVYDYSAWEEAWYGKRDYRVWSHDDPPMYNVRYAGNPYCNTWGYIVW